MTTLMRTILPPMLLLAACTGPSASTDTATTGTDTSTGTDTATDTATDTDTDTEGEAPQVFTACDAEFTITEPNPMYAWTPNAITLKSEELAPGVFAVYDQLADSYGPSGIPLATSGGFVIGDEGVVMIETMINRQLFCQVIDLIQEETDKPVLYAINTSYHGDHSFGNAYLPDEVLVVQHAEAAKHIAANFDEDIVFMEMGFGADQDIAEAIPVVADVLVDDSGWSIDMGGVSVEAQYHGFGQTEGDLFIYVPEAKVLWTGNPLVAQGPALPWLLDGHASEVSSTLAAVKASLPADAIIIPGHSHPLGPDGFDFAVDYLDTLIVEVQGAVDDGMSLEQTQASVTMDAFAGYALWDWIHTGVNVTATYSELGG